MTYASATESILSEDAQRKSFEQSTSSEAYTVQDIDDRHYRSWSSSRGSNTSRSRSKARDTRRYNECKKAGHIKVDCQALKAKNKKAQEPDNTPTNPKIRPLRHPKVDSTFTTERVTTQDKHMVTMESITWAEVLLTTE